MSIAKILVPLRGTPHDLPALAMAFAAAKPFPAHVAALCIRPDPSEILIHLHGVSSPSTLEQIVSAARADGDAMAKEARRNVMTAVAAAGARLVDIPERGAGMTCSLADVEGRFVEVVAHQARYADLVCFGPITAVERSVLGDAFVETLVECGKPVLLSSQTPPRDVGRRVAIGWDGGLAASHAIAAAMDILEKAEAVEVLVVKRPAQEGPPTAELQKYLALHGVASKVYVIEHDGGAGSKLQEAASNHQCDLLVVGGYGHSRIRETIFGGVTAHLTSHTTLPVFMVH
jgi:nucleotide-binding universal stress UspA family protein